MQPSTLTPLAERLKSQLDATMLQKLRDNGHARLRALLTAGECDQLVSLYPSASSFRKTIIMERYRFGIGEYRYFQYPLPVLVAQLRSELYPPLASIANEWNRTLGLQADFPSTHEELLTQCRAAGQSLPTPLVLKYEAGGYNTLHQDIYGEVFFPMQVVFLLNDPGRDFQGGEFILTEQLPRAQSRATVVHLDRGDALIFTTRYRPVRGRNGFYRVNVKHGVSTVHQGIRYAMGIIFHEAAGAP